MPSPAIDPPLSTSASNAGHRARLSVLDLVPVSAGGSVGAALAAAAELAATADDLGFARYWVAEHHGSTGLAGAAVAVVLAHVAPHTQAIRLGAGGIMLPNHNPLVIAEQFGTLAALYPGRIDLGLGRAPGADQRIVRALRKDVNRAADDFPHDVVELMRQFAGAGQVALQATPGGGAALDLWMLGSSLFGAELAALLGLPYAFAAHFAPDQLDAAIARYRARFTPSPHLAAPYVMVAANAFAAESTEVAWLLASSQDQAFVKLRSGEPGPIPPPRADYRDHLPAPTRAMLEHLRSVSAIGDPPTVVAALDALARRTGADELILAGATFDPADRRRSLALIMAEYAEPACNLVCTSPE